MMAGAGTPVALAAKDTDALHPFRFAFTAMSGGQLISGEVAVASVQRSNLLMDIFST